MPITTPEVQTVDRTGRRAATPPTWTTSPLVRARPSRATAAEWDAFAQRCGASFRGSWRGAWAWQFEAHWWFRLRRFDLVDAEGRKAGQCAVGVGRRWRVFADGVQLLGDDGELWPMAMAAVLRQLGRGRYVYGSEWSVEPPRQDALLTLIGVAVNEVRPTGVDVIDFRRWPTVEQYRRGVSENVRRNSNKAARAYPDLAVVDVAGAAAWRAYAAAAVLRRDLFRRKHVARGTVGMVARSAARIASLRRYTRLTTLTAGGRLLSYHVGVNFGPLACYLEGATAADADGAAWHLLLRMIERAFAATGGQGRFVMGSDDGSQDGVAAWEGLRRSRRQCCAERVETSVVRFRYDPAG